MLQISVPCGSCSAPIGFRDRICPSCRVRVPRELRSALEARLEASSTEFRELKEHIHNAASVLLILGLLHLGVGVVLFLVERGADVVPAQNAAGEAVAGLIERCTIGLAFLACYASVKRAPAPAMMAALGIWCGAQIIYYMPSPQSFLYAFMGATGVARLVAKLAVLVLLLRGIRSALQARALERRLASTSG